MCLSIILRSSVGHRAHTVFVGVHMPSSRRHSHRRHKHHHKDGDRISEYDRPSEYKIDISHLHTNKTMIAVYKLDKLEDMKF